MAKLSPIGNVAQFINGIPANGAKLFTYVAGSSTKLTTYTDDGGLTAQANPIILDSRGEPAQPIWLTEGLNYKFVFAPSTDSDPPVSPIWDVDDVTGINDSSVSLDQWIDSGLTPTYVNATQFTLVGDQTTAFQVNRRIKATVTAGTVYGYISVSAYTSLTTVTVVLDSGTLDNGLSAVQLGLITPSETSLPNTLFMKTGGTITGGTTFSADVTMSGSMLSLAKGADVASATALPLITDGNYFDVTGTTTVTSFNSVGVGSVVMLHFDDALTLTHNATDLILPGGNNILTAAGDEALFVEYASGDYRCISYTRASHSSVRVNVANGVGSTNTAIRRFTNILTNIGADITYADSSTLGGSFTINSSGIYAISYNDQFNGGVLMGISLNSTQLTTAIQSITAADALNIVIGPTANGPANAQWTGYLPAGSVIRAHASVNPTTGTTTSAVQFTITRVN